MDNASVCVGAGGGGGGGGGGILKANEVTMAYVTISIHAQRLEITVKLLRK